MRHPCGQRRELSLRCLSRGSPSLQRRELSLRCLSRASPLRSCSARISHFVTSRRSRRTCKRERKLDRKNEQRTSPEVSRKGKLYKQIVEHLVCTREKREREKNKAFKDERTAASPQTAAHLVPDATPSSRKGHVRTCERVFNARYITEAPSSHVPPGGFLGSELADILVSGGSTPLTSRGTRKRSRFGLFWGCFARFGERSLCNAAACSNLHIYKQNDPKP